MVNCNGQDRWSSFKLQDHLVLYVRDMEDDLVFININNDTLLSVMTHHQDQDENGNYLG